MGHPITFVQKLPGEIKRNKCYSTKLSTFWTNVPLSGKGEFEMMYFIILAVLVFCLSGCAGLQVVHTTPKYQFDKSKRFLVFPFRDPSYKDKEIAGTGGRLTNPFAAACSQYGLNIIPIFNDKFQPSKNVNILDAIAYAKENGVDFIITGQVTKWVDRATEWSGKRDFLGLAIFVRDVGTGKIVFSAELQEHSNIFWSGTPDDFTHSLSRAIAEKFLGIEK